MGNKAIFETFFQALLDGDIPRMTTYLADDAVFHEAAVLPYGGDHVGIDGFLKLTEMAMSAFAMDFLTTDLWEVDDRVIVNMSIRWTSRRTGETFDMPVVELYSFKDGKIVDADIYYKDPGLVAAAA